MNGGYLVIAAVLALIVLLIILLCFPLSFYIKYVGQELYAELRFLFLKKRLMPQDKKEKKSGNKIEQREDKPKKDKKTKEAFFDTLERFVELLSAGGALGKLALSLHSCKIDFDVKVGGEDAAQTAIECGKLSAYLHTAAAITANFVKVKSRKIMVYPDYNSKETEYVLSAKLYSHPIAYIFNIHKILPLLLRLAEALPPKDNKKGEKKQ